MRSTLKYDIIRPVEWGDCFMKTKIIYISGNEIFDVNDIRAAFEEVRNALNLDKTTVLFGVPVDTDDAGLMKTEQPQITETSDVIDEPETQTETTETFEPEPQEEIQIITDTEPVEEIIEETVEEPVVEQPKKRGRARKENTENIADETEEKVVPILSILSTKDEPETATETTEPTIEIVQETIVAEIPAETTEDIVEEEVVEQDDEEEDLEKLLSAMTPLQEDVVENKKAEETPIETPEEPDISVDATLEQLATEFAETQDRIATESKSSSRSKIGKLRNILPFKQSKHKDQGLGDLFGWAGVAANDEDFSVPGFFTNAASKK